MLGAGLTTATKLDYDTVGQCNDDPTMPQYVPIQHQDANGHTTASYTDATGSKVTLDYDDAAGTRQVTVDDTAGNHDVYVYTPVTDGSLSYTHTSTNAKGVTYSLTENASGTGTDTYEVSGSGCRFTDPANTLQVDGGAFVYVGGDGDVATMAANATVAYAGNNIQVTGTGANDRLTFGDPASGISSVTVDLTTGTATTSMGTVKLSGVDHVTGTSGNDAFTMGASAETIDGNGGSDTLKGGDGAVNYTNGIGGSSVSVTRGKGTLNVSAGSVSVDYSGASQGITLTQQVIPNAPAGSSMVLAGGGAAQGDTLSATGVMAVTGTAYADTVRTSAGIAFTGNGGDDNFYASGSNGKRGTATNLVTLGDGNHVAVGGEGADAITTGKGNSDVDPGIDPFPDKVAFGQGTNTLDFAPEVGGSVHLDLVKGGSYGVDPATGARVNLNLTVSGPVNRIVGTSGNDYVAAQPGVAYVDGGTGVDTLVAATTGSTLTAQGVAPSQAETFSNIEGLEPSLYGQNGNDTITSSPYGGLVCGEGGYNVVRDGASADSSSVTVFEVDIAAGGTTVINNFRYQHDIIDFVGGSAQGSHWEYDSDGTSHITCGGANVVVSGVYGDKILSQADVNYAAQHNGSGNPQHAPANWLFSPHTY